MYDVNPLGPQMHLKQLERSAAPMLRPVRFGNQSDSRVATLCTVMISLLRRLQAGIPRRMVGQDRGI
jgi:hypothetical protein